MRRLIVSRLIRIYTVCHTVLIHSNGCRANSISPAEPNIFANSADSEKTIHNELFVVLFWFLTETTIWSNGSDKIQIWKSALQELNEEKVNSKKKLDRRLAKF